MLEMFKQLVYAVYKINKKEMIHRDIKYDNIMFEILPEHPNFEKIVANKAIDFFEGNHFVLKLIDFGVSKQSNFDINSEKRGNENLMAPEVLED